MPRVGVALLTMGEPDNLDEVRPYLRELLSDPDLVRLPVPAVQPLFAMIVSGLYEGRLRRNLAAIGGGSPLKRWTELQRQALQQALSGSGDFRVYAAMRYGRPSAAEAVRRMIADSVERIVALPLYPQFCRATTGSSLHDLRRSLQRLEAGIPVTELRSWPDHPAYLEALEEQVARALTQTAGQKVHVLVSAHGVPRSFIDGGDPYLKEVELTAAALNGFFPNVSHSLAFQSRTGRGRWLGPDILAETERLGRSGVEALVVVPVSFVCDNSETLHELDIVVRRAAAVAGVKSFLRVPAFNDNPAFIAVLKDLILSTQAEHG
jgi:ferrochelatase